MLSPLLKTKGVYSMANIISELGTAVGSLALSNVLSALVSLIICLIAIRLITKVTDKLLRRSKLTEQVQKYVRTAIRLVLYVIGALIVVESLGIKTTSLVAFLSVGSLGITLAAEDVLGNVAGGLVILSSHPFNVGDTIETSGAVGTVTEITLNHTKLQTVDGLTILLPNQELASSKITNYSVLGRRRVTQKVTASYDAPTATVKKACWEALANTPYVLEDPASNVVLSNYGDSAIEYTIFCWTETAHYGDVLFGLSENLRDAFEKHNVEMTYNHLNVHILDK